MSTAHREAEKEIQLRAHLREIDDRLEQAIRSRNDYFDYLKTKYPNLSSDRFETAKTEERESTKFSNWNARGVRKIITRDPSNPDPHAQSMLILTPQERPPSSRFRHNLKTNVYHWEMGRNPPPKMAHPPAPLPKLSDPMPVNGMVLQSDLPRIRVRLSEIKSDLADLRDQRMFMSSADYHRTILPSKDRFMSTLNAFRGISPSYSLNTSFDYAVPNAIPNVAKRSDRSFAEILNKLTEITEESHADGISHQPVASMSETFSQKDVEIDRMFEKMRDQVASESRSENLRTPASPPKRTADQPKENEDTFVSQQEAGIQFDVAAPKSPKKEAPILSKPATLSYNHFFTPKEKPKHPADFSSDTDSDDSFPAHKKESVAPLPVQDDFLARFLFFESPSTN
ncbi:hypothetical protein L596_027664 [Steinernema carpocapsae]|uniref:Uncharacterized protein n=1 Tax=Steinernema carpocapsae TaxID=34508 RepID=A0A4U5LW84_STECR|nr:hypothetical protein L596_027664 [Steinernema carpocapsae]